MSRPDPTSKSFWKYIPIALEAIARKSSSHSDTSNLYDVNKNTGRVSLHVQWALDDVSTWSSIGNNHINPHPPVDWHHTGSWTLVKMISLSSSKQASSNLLLKPFIFYFALFMGKRFFQMMVRSGTLAQWPIVPYQLVLESSKSTFYLSKLGDFLFSVICSCLLTVNKF